MPLATPAISNQNTIVSTAIQAISTQNTVQMLQLAYAILVMKQLNTVRTVFLRHNVLNVKAI